MLAFQRPLLIFSCLRPRLTSPLLLPIPDSVEDELELSTVRHRPEGLEQLEAQTRFSRKELQILYRGFKNVRQQPSSHHHPVTECQSSNMKVYAANAADHPPLQLC